MTTRRSARRTTEAKAPWTCRKCQKSFAKKNQFHMCESSSLDELAMFTAPDLEPVLTSLVGFVRKLDSVTVSTSKKAVTFSAGVAFGFAHPKAKWIDLCLFFSEPPDDERLIRTTRYSKKRVACFFRLQAREDMDLSLKDLVRRAHSEVLERSA